MLRLLSLALGIILALAASSCVSYEGRVSYVPEVIPSCVIVDEDGYWKWRDTVPPSPNLDDDIKALYARFSSRYLILTADLKNPRRKNEFKNESRFVEAMCSKDIIYSVELARVMNAHGSNVSPRSLLAAMESVFEADQFKNENYNVDYDAFNRVMRSVLLELESRFDLE